jgi:hypothetical protein
MTAWHLRLRLPFTPASTSSVPDWDARVGGFRASVLEDLELPKTGPTKAITVAYQLHLSRLRDEIGCYRRNHSNRRAARSHLPF